MEKEQNRWSFKRKEKCFSDRQCKSRTNRQAWSVFLLLMIVLSIQQVWGYSGTNGYAYFLESNITINT